MQWVAPSEKDTATDTLEQRLWEATDQLRANSGLTSAQYSTPVLGLIFLRFADVRFAKMRAALEKMASSSRRGSHVDEPTVYHAERPLNPNSICRNVVRKYGLEMGLNIEVNGLGVYSMQATAATNALSHEADNTKVQEWLGHANVATAPFI